MSVEISQRMFSEIMPAFTEMAEMFISLMKTKNSEKRALFSIKCSCGHRQPKLAVCVLGDFIDSLNISLRLKNEQAEMKTQIKKRVNKTLLTFYLLLLDVN